MNITVPDTILEVGSPDLEKSKEMQKRLSIVIHIPCPAVPYCGFLLQTPYSELTVDRMMSALLQIAAEEEE